MIECALIRDGNVLRPYSAEDRLKLLELDQKVILRATIRGAKRARSYQQLALFWSVCRAVADQSDDPEGPWGSPEAIAELVKLHTGHVKRTLIWTDRYGNQHANVQTRSISYEELPRMEANRFFDRAFEYLAAHLGTTVDDLTSVARDQYAE